MRIIPFTISTIITIALIVALDNKWGAVPPLGRFLSPQQGFWQNAEAVDGDRNEEIHLQGLKGKVDVYLDDRLVPHVFAEHDEDAYYVQGFLHAKYRLWQMELQTFAAAGRISEKMGNDPRYIGFDREQRRLGMVYAAENALKEFEADPNSKATCDAYTAGVNAYINTLTESTLPLEYKLLNYRPEPWSNLKIALFLKQMSKTLADYSPDLALTQTKLSFSFEEMMELDPQVPDSLAPIIPPGTIFDTAGIVPVVPASADSLYFGRKDSVQVNSYAEQDPNNGSNNWVVSGKKTLSGAPILCNDPHLELTFPSIWYEMQITTPNLNVYGVTFPGSPNIIIGFNNDIAWGVTNSQRDVKDFFEIRFKDESKKEYWFNGQWENTNIRIDTIKVRGGDDVYDTIAYTAFGPVMYDKSFSKNISGNKAIAVTWSAHEASNEGLTFYQLNRARNYDEYLSAIKHFSCPGQNFVFASKSGDIAIWQQGKFPARWYGQGMYLMPGEDSSYMWQGSIPQEENPHILNPDTGYIQSANQRAVDSTYPYFIPGGYITARGIALGRKLSAMQQVTPDDMKALQNDNYHLFAESVRPMLLKYVNAGDLDADASRYLDIFRKWDLIASPTSTGTTIFQTWFDSLETLVWKDEWNRDSLTIGLPDEQTLLEWINKDSAFRYIDNVNTPQQETIGELVTNALVLASAGLKKQEDNGTLEWTKFKDPAILHLLRDAVMPFARKVAVGGWSNVINATTKTHGPSWRMIVHLTGETEAYGVYPGGQSGNPGSPFYDNMVDTW
ncbi:MAG: penicillin acylase family protein, partial [Flavisolibacter sp.]